MYSVMKDTEGAYDALPVSDRDHGGRWFLQKALPGQTFMNLTFEAPPDTVKQVDVIIPWFAPLQAVQLSGEGGAASTGSAVKCRTMRLFRTTSVKSTCYSFISDTTINAFLQLSHIQEHAFSSCRSGGIVLVST